MSMGEKFLPVCSGACSNAWPIGVYNALHAQKMGFNAIQRTIIAKRHKGLTPAKMKAESLELQRRIKVARGIK